MTANLSPEARSAAIEKLQAAELDVLVIGGGVVGAGSALDAATRGLRVGLVEQRDWASGTSSRSSKLMHGGLRYLEMLDFKLVHEALIERGLSLTKLAPHLVRPVSFLYPLTHRVWERPYIGAGIALYDGMARTSGTSAGLPLHRHFGSKGLRKIAPALKPSAMHGAIRYYDAQVDDARHTMTIVRTAAEYGAHVANRVEVTSFIKDGERVVGANVRDLESGKEFGIKARVVVNATGVWTDDIQKIAGTDGDFHVRMSKGVHFLVAKEKLHLDTGLILRTEKSVLFVIPWGNHWIIGTTDTDWQLDKQDPAISAGDINYLLEHVNAVVQTPLTVDDIEGVYAGLRPLVAGASASTAKLSREHVVGQPVPGLVVIAGGKYTTYRVMAEDAVNEAVKILGGAIPASTTKDVPLTGADGYKAMLNAKVGLAKQSGLSVATIEHLLGRYGSLTNEVLELVHYDNSLGAFLSGTTEYIKAEALYAATHEGARSLDDVLSRRVRLSIETKDRGTAAAQEIADLIAPVLGWDAKRIEAEVDGYVAQVEAERTAQTKPDDATANAARVAAS